MQEDHKFEHDFFHRFEFEVPCDSEMPFENYLVCDEMLPVRHQCTNVHVTHVDDQCHGQHKNLVAFYDAVMRDEEMWREDITHW